MTILERAERRLRQRWYDLELAERQNQTAEVLQQRYDRYFTALRAYTAAFESCTVAPAGDERALAS